MERPRIRSWRERWDPTAEFVFAKRLKLGLKDLEVVQPGDPVPRIHFGLARLRRWWESKTIRLANPGQRPVDVPCVVRLTAAVWELRIPGQPAVRLDSADEAQKMLAKAEKRSRKAAV